MGAWSNLAGTDALVAALPALAQPVVLAPGHPDLDLEAVRPSDSEWTFRTVDPQDESLGTLAERVVLEDGALTVVRVTRVPMADVDTRDSTRFAWPSLTPAFEVVRGADGEALSRVAFGDGRLEGEYDAGGRPLPFAFDLGRAAFPQAALWLVVRALPLDRAGYRAVLPTFSATERFGEALLTVVGPETVTLPDGSERATVAVDQVGGGGMAEGARLRYSVDPATRELVRTEIAVPDDMTVHLVPSTPAALPGGD